jgi:hypothetical protein
MSIVAMKRKYNEKIKAKPKTKKNIHLNCNMVAKANRKPISYSSYIKKKSQRCECAKSLTVKNNLMTRLTASQKIAHKKLDIIQKTICNCKPVHKTTRSNCKLNKMSVDYVKGNNKTRFCNTTKELAIPGNNSCYSNTSYNEYLDFKKQTVYRETDYKNLNAKNGRCAH